jgi:hypothetical protein
LNIDAIQRASVCNHQGLFLIVVFITTIICLFSRLASEDPNIKLALTEAQVCLFKGSFRMLPW